MTTCPKCGYDRTKNDDAFVSADECPKCGIFYKKWISSAEHFNTGTVLSSDTKANAITENKSPKFKPYYVITAVIVLIAAFVTFNYFKPHKLMSAKESLSGRVVSTLPVAPVKWMESSAYLISNNEKADSLSAAGQIFIPPSKTHFLFKVGFLFAQTRLAERVPEIRLRLILSEWNIDHPGPTALFVSEPATILNNGDDLHVEWLDFDVPSIRLNPQQHYIAWVTLSDLGNLPDARIGIKAMGPIFKRAPSDIERQNASTNSPYPQGMCALLKLSKQEQDEPHEILSKWEMRDFGYNLHFRMSFENKSDEQVNKNNYGYKNQMNEQADATTQQKEMKNLIEKQREQKRLETEQLKDKRRTEMEQQEFEARQRAEQRRIDWEKQQEAREKQEYENEQRRTQQRVEREIQQYEREKLQNEMQLRQQQQNEIDRSSGANKRLYPRGRRR